jgi:translin
VGALADKPYTALAEVYDRLMTVDFPDAVTAGLRRTTDALRAVTERSRAESEPLRLAVLRDVTELAESREDAVSGRDW